MAGMFTNLTRNDTDKLKEYVTYDDGVSNRSFPILKVHTKSHQSYMPAAPVLTARWRNGGDSDDALQLER